MSKRNMVIAVMALVMALSAMAFAAMPAAPSAGAAISVDGVQIAKLYAPAQFDQDFDPPYCPMPTTPGCGGG